MRDKTIIKTKGKNGYFAESPGTGSTLPGAGKKAEKIFEEKTLLRDNRIIPCGFDEALRAEAPRGRHSMDFYLRW